MPSTTSSGGRFRTLAGLGVVLFAIAALTVQARSVSKPHFVSILSSAMPAKARGLRRHRAAWRTSVMAEMATPNPNYRPPHLDLGITGSRFTFNGTPTFLYGISYYAALGGPAGFVRRDLNDMQRLGFNWIRVWATWNAFGTNLAVVHADGSARERFLERLRRLVAQCDRRGMIVDVTLSRDKRRSGVRTQTGHLQAVATLIAALRPRRNWYLDLANERNIHDGRFTSLEDLAALRALARRLDPVLLVTASHGGDITRAELRDYLEVAHVDFIAPHRPRAADSPRQTEARTRQYLAWMAALGRVVPVLYQEPFRRGYGDWQPQVSDYLEDARGAIAAAAAGWCFHNGSQRGVAGERPRRSFDLRQQRLFNQLDPVERRAIAALDAAINSRVRQGP